MNALVHQNRPRTPLDIFMGKVITIEDREELKAALPRHVSYDRFERNLINALMAEPKLMTCEPRQVLKEVMKIAALGLVIDAQLGEAYLIVGYSGGKNTPQVRIGYRGLIKLARQSGEVAKVYAHEVCANDKVKGRLGTDKFLEHEPDFFGDRGAVIGFYAVIQFKDGESDFEAMNVAQIAAVRDKTDAYKAFKKGLIKSTPWDSSFDEMAKKTVIRRLLKRSPQSPDLLKAFNVEDTSDGGGNESLRRIAPPRQFNPLSDEPDPMDQTEHDPETGEVKESDDEAPETASEAEMKPEAPKPKDEPKSKPAAKKQADEASIALFERDCEKVETMIGLHGMKEMIDLHWQHTGEGIVKRAESAVAAAEARIRAFQIAANAEEAEEPTEVKSGDAEVETAAKEPEQEKPAAPASPATDDLLPPGDYSVNDRKWLTNVAKALSKAPSAEELMYLVDSYREPVKFKAEIAQKAYATLCEQAKARFIPNKG